MIHTGNVALVVLALSAAEPTGVYFEQTTVVRPAGAVGGTGVRSRVHYAAKRLRLEAGDVEGGPAFVLRLDEGRAFRLDPETRVAVEIELGRLRAQSHEDASVAGSLMGGADAMRVTPLEGRRTIAGHACRGFRLRGGQATVDAWVAEDLPLRAELFVELLEWSGAARSLGGLVAAVRELPGFPLETRTRLSVLGETQETVSTIDLIRVGPQPAELFEVPAGWRLEKGNH